MKNERTVDARLEVYVTGVRESRVANMIEDIADLLVLQYALGNDDEDADLRSLIIAWADGMPSLDDTFARKLTNAMQLVIPRLED
jgi:hypothetical protein